MNGVLTRCPRGDFRSFGQNLGNDAVRDDRSLLFIRRPNTCKDNNLLRRPAILFVDPHNIQQLLRSKQLRSRNAFDPWILQRHRQVIRLQAPRQPAHPNLSEDSERSSNLRLKNHTHADTFAMQNAGRQHSLDSMSDGVSEVDKIAQASLALVYSNYVGFHRYGAVDNG